MLRASAYTNIMKRYEPIIKFGEYHDDGCVEMRESASGTYLHVEEVLSELKKLDARIDREIENLSNIIDTDCDILELKNKIKTVIIALKN